MEYKIGVHAIEEAKRCDGCGHVYQDLGVTACDCMTDKPFTSCFIIDKELMEKIKNLQINSKCFGA